jgi:hypothetical protein
MRDGTGALGDLAYFDVESAQPAGRAIMAIPFPTWKNTSWQAMLAASPSYDFSRIDAVLIDEPYWEDQETGGIPQNPCAPGRPSNDTRCGKVHESIAVLQALGAALKATSPKTRFWLNFSESECQWLGFGSQNSAPPLPLYGRFVDVVSVDKYGGDFTTSVAQIYDFFLAHRSMASQQVALVPGTFVLEVGGVIVGGDASQQAARLLSYFAYATQKNATCNLPIGRLGITGSFDGCPVWGVWGWLAGDAPGSAVSFYGLSTSAPPPSRVAPLVAAWNAEKNLPLVRSVQAAAGAITAVIAPL